MQLSKTIKLISVALLLGSIVAIDLIQPATASPSQGTLVAARRRLRFRVGVRPSRYRIGGFSRGSSCGSQKTLTALVPPPQTQERLPRDRASVDKTSAEHPTFFIHLPSLPATSAQFTLQNETGTRELHSTDFDVTGQPGVVGITLPSSKPGLQVGQKYLWQVAVACNPDEPSNLAIVGGWIERVQSPATGTNRITILAEQGVWQDVVTTLALQRYQKPSDRTVAEDWAALMEDAGLPQFKQSAVIQIVRK